MSATDEASPTCPVWHPSFAPAAIPPLETPAPTEVGRQALAALLAARRASCGTEQTRIDTEGVTVTRAAWAQLPQLYRRMVVAAAGLPADVVEKRDRDLTEREKVMMRSGISDMRTWLESVAAL